MYVNEFPEVDDVVMVQVLLFLVFTEECLLCVLICR